MQRMARHFLCSITGQTPSNQNVTSGKVENPCIRMGTPHPLAACTQQGLMSVWDLLDPWKAHARPSEYSLKSPILV